MVYGFLRALPGDHRFVDPVIRATRWRLANLTPASGRQNHTASPSATRSARRTLRCVHRIPPHVRDDRDTPLHRGGIARLVVYISEKRKLNIFRGRAGQEFADAARRANQLTKNVAKWLRRRAFFSLPPAQASRAGGVEANEARSGWRQAPGGGSPQARSSDELAETPTRPTFGRRPSSRFFRRENIMTGDVEIGHE